MEKIDCLIFGAGIAGSALAVGLRKQGLSVLVVEKSKVTTPIFKGEYIQPAALETLVDLGFDEILKTPSSQKIRELFFHDLNSRGETFSEVLMQYPKNISALAISHFDLLQSLRKKLGSELGSNFMMGAEANPVNASEKDFLTNPKFDIVVDNKVVRSVCPRWVVGCEGRNSIVRKWIGGAEVPKNGPVVLGTSEEMIVGLELESSPAIATRYQVSRTYGKGTVSAFSLGKNGQRVYYSAPIQEGAPLKKQWVSALNEISSQLAPEIELGEITENTKLQGFPAFTKYLSKGFPGAFLLAGDSVAVTTPYGGQGITAAMEHIRYLLGKFDWNEKSAVTIALHKQAYEQLTINTHERIGLLNFGLYNLFFSREPAMKFVTHHIANVWNQNPAMRDEMMNLFGGVDTTKPGLFKVLKLWGLTPMGATATIRSLLESRLFKMDLRRIG